MFPALIGGIALLIGLILLAKWWLQAEPKQIIRVVRWTALIVGVAGGILLILAARWSWLPFIALFALPWLSRMRALRSYAKNAQGPTRGQTSNIETQYLRMSLDHDTGEMEGEVKAGRFAGRRLSELKLGEQLDLCGECAGDADSLQVLESYLDRVHGADWRDMASQSGDAGAHGTAAPAGADMSVEEACEVLGVAADASADEIEQAYRRLMKKAHPDQGGSDWMAAKINQAKELLLAR